ncbi:MAG: DUF58 domain-containing protein [Bacillota bacterium]
MRELDDLFLIILAIIGLVSIFARHYLLFFSSIIFILLIYLARFWNKEIFTKFNVKRNLNRKHVVIGEKLNYKVEVENNKIMPVLGIVVKDRVSKGIKFINQNFEEKVPGNNFNIFQDVFSLRWYEKIKRSYDIIPEKRGYYSFGKGNIFYSGIFGLYKNQYRDQNYAELIVYPKILDAKNLDVDLKHIFGTTAAEGWIHKDPLNSVGVRPYESTDSIKKINWKATARHASLESNIYKPSYDKEIHIFLSTLTIKEWWLGINKNKLELLIIYAASIVNYAIDNGYQVGIYSDGRLKKSSSFLDIKAAKGSIHKEKLLSSLAMLQEADKSIFAEILFKKKKTIKAGSTIIVVLAIVNEEIIKVLNQYRKKYNLSLIIIGEGDKRLEKLQGVKIYKVNEEEDWDEIKKMGLV